MSAELLTAVRRHFLGVGSPINGRVVHENEMAVNGDPGVDFHKVGTEVNGDTYAGQAVLRIPNVFPAMGNYGNPRGLRKGEAGEGEQRDETVIHPNAGPVQTGGGAIPVQEATSFSAACRSHTTGVMLKA
jgi:hypothetical protein